MVYGSDVRAAWRGGKAVGEGGSLFHVSKAGHGAPLFMRIESWKRGRGNVVVSLFYCAKMGFGGVQIKDCGRFSV